MKAARKLAAVGRGLGLTGFLGLSVAQLGAAQQNTSQLPSARQIVARYIEAIGGRDAVRRRKFLHVAGTWSTPSQGLSGSYETFAAAPNKMFYRVEIPVMGERVGGFNGRVGWEIHPVTGPTVLEGKALDRIRQEADFYYQLHDERTFMSLETVEQTEFEGQDCYKLRLVSSSGEEYFEFFSMSTGLLAGRLSAEEWPTGPIIVTTVFGDYEQFRKLLVPTTVIQKLPMGLERIDTIATIEDMEFDLSVFDLPPEIQTLLPGSGN